MEEQRSSRARMAQGMAAALAGESSPRSKAFCRNVCELLSMWGNAMSSNKWAS